MEKKHYEDIITNSRQWNIFTYDLKTQHDGPMMSTNYLKISGWMSRLAATIFIRLYLSKILWCVMGEGIFLKQIKRYTNGQCCRSLRSPRNQKRSFFLTLYFFSTTIKHCTRLVLYMNSSRNTLSQSRGVICVWGGGGLIILLRVWLPPLGPILDGFFTKLYLHSSGRSLKFLPE